VNVDNSLSVADAPFAGRTREAATGGKSVRAMINAMRDDPSFVSLHFESVAGEYRT